MRAMRIIDVNLNRLTEALKVVEDITRLELGDAGLLRRVRGLRARLNPVVIPLRRRVVSYRRSGSDPGRGRGFDRAGRRDLGEVLVANLKRAQEACRVLDREGSSKCRYQSAKCKLGPDNLTSAT